MFTRLRTWIRALPTSDRWSSPLVQWMVTLLLAAVAFGLGYAGFDGYLRGQCEFSDTGVLDRIYYTLQLFVLDPTPFGTGPYSQPLEWARFLAPLSTVLAVVQAVAGLLSNWFRASRFRNAKDHVVVLGDGPAPAALAKRLVSSRRRDPKVVYVGSGVPPEHASRHGLLVVPGEGADMVTLRAAGVARAGTVFVMTPIGATNAAVAIAVRKLRTGPVKIFLQIHDDELVTALRARRTDVATADLEFFVLEDVAARVLLDRFPPVDPTGSPRPVVVAGSGMFARAVLRELVRRWRRQAVGATMTIVTKQGPVVTGLLEELAVIGGDRAADEVVGANIASTMPHDARAALVYACQVDADEVLRTGLGALLAGAETAVLCLGRRAELGGALDEHQIFDNADGKLAVFGILDEAFDEDRIHVDRIDRLGRALHADYLAGRLADNEVLGTRPSLVEWRDLPDGYRQDNYRQARDIQAELAHIGARLVPVGPGFAAFTFRDDEVLDLAEREHQRRRQDKVDDGATHGNMKTWGELGVSLPTIVGDAGFQIVRDP